MGTTVDPAFKVVPRNQSSFLIWRIENFQPVAVPRDQYGNFYDGDCYLILCIKESKGSMDMRIHFWLGENASQDESGTAAIKAVELDDYLGGGPVQYREVQGRESKQFLNYFKTKGGVKYSKGGVASGFNHVDKTFKPRLMHVKGKSTPRIKEIDIGWDKMNSGDAFILDIGEALYVWNGKSCSRTERIKAMDYARKMRDDRGKGNLIVVEEGEENADQMGSDEYALFDEYLPLKHKNVIKAANAAGADDTYERKAAANVKLWKCSDEGGALKVTEIAQKPLTRKMLDTNDCFIVDCGDAGIWVWCGKKANSTERKEGMANALAFIKQRNYSTNVSVTKVNESGEPTEFKSLFKSWDPILLPGQVAPYSRNKIAKVVQTKFDAATMHSNPQAARETGMVDDGTGKKEIYRIEDHDIKPLDKRYHGQLFGGDAYIIQYTYEVNGRENYILYYWLGRKAAQDEKGAAALKVVELDDKLGGAAKQVRIVQGKEPNHFMSMFEGKLIIFEGGKAGWGQQQVDGPGDTYMLHVRGTSKINTKAEQVPLRAESLNSNDVFVLFSKKEVFIWAGKGSTGDEREMAKQVASLSPRGYNIVMEGQEKEDFWELLGGKGEYSSTPRLAESTDHIPPRLFQCSNASGNFKVDEIVDFGQVDLVTEDVFLLDSVDQIYVWIGEDARPEEKTMSMDAAIEYMETDPSGRDKDTPIFAIKQGYEPPDFVGYFGVWDRDLWSGGKSYEQLKSEMKNKNIGMEQIKAKSQSNGDASFSDVAKYSYAQLRNRDGLPDTVDTQTKEKYLSDEEFQKVFGMNYASFVGLPVWKQQRMKKEKDLF